MSVQLSYKDGELTARLSGEIDHHAAREMRVAIDDTAQKVKPRVLRLDFSQVPFMDSSGIGALMGRYKRMKEKGGKVMICGVGDRIRRVLRIAAIDTLLPEIEKKEKKS